MALALILAALAAPGCGHEVPRDGGTDHEPTIYQVAVDQPTAWADGSTVGGFARIVWAGQLSDGSLVIADQSLGELTFHPSDRMAFVAGGRGGGPGEFAAILDGGLLAGDSVLVSGLRRISVFAPDGSFVRSIPNPSPGRHEVLGVMADSLLVIRIPIPGSEEEGLRTDSAVYTVLMIGTGEARSSFTLEDRTSYLSGANEPRPFWTFPPFFGRAVSGVQGGTILWGHGRAPVLHRLDVQGNRLGSIPLPITPRRVTADDMARAKAERFKRAADDRGLLRKWEQMFSEVTFPALAPFFGELIVAPHGLLWLEVPGMPGDDEVEWRAYDDRGTPQGTLRVPANLSVLQFTDSSVVAVDSDTLGVQRVVALRLTPDPLLEGRR